MTPSSENYKCIGPTVPPSSLIEVSSASDGLQIVRDHGGDKIVTLPEAKINCTEFIDWSSRSLLAFTHASFSSGMNRNEFDQNRTDKSIENLISAFNQSLISGGGVEIIRKDCIENLNKALGSLMEALELPNPPRHIWLKLEVGDSIPQLDADGYSHKNDNEIALFLLLDEH